MDLSVQVIVPWTPPSRTHLVRPGTSVRALPGMIAAAISPTKSRYASIEWPADQDLPGSTMTCSRRCPGTARCPDDLLRRAAERRPIALPAGRMELNVGPHDHLDRVGIPSPIGGHR